jgi:hypothetical protein
MLDRFLGGYVTASPTAPTQTSAQGVWELEQQASAQVQNAWPLPPNVIQRSLRFNSADSTRLTRTTSFSGTTVTWSFWVKRSAITGAYQCLFGSSNGSTASFGIYFNASEQIEIQNYASAYTGRLVTSAVYRDISAWYHIVVVIDTTNGTPGDRMRLYVNGSEVTSFSTDTQPSSSASFYTATSVSWSIGNEGGSANNYYFNGYIADFYIIDGQALTPSSFGETDPQTGVWIPKVYTGSYGTNGFRLRFNNNSSTTALGYDTSGNGNNWTPNNFSVTAGSGNDSMLDVPSLYGTDTGLGGEVRGNYCTLNPILQNSWWAAVPKGNFANGNLDISVSGSDGSGFSTWDIPTDVKIYFEVTAGTVSSSSAIVIGAAARATFEVGYYTNGNKQINGATPAAYGATWTTGDIIGVAIDRSANSITFYKNGVSQGAIVNTFPSQTVLMGCYLVTGQSLTFNFGQRPFAYTAPSGFKALCTTNLSASGTVTTSGTFTGNASTDGPFVYLNGIPTAMTINGNAVTFGTQADKLSNGFKVRSSSSSYNTSGSNTYSVSTTGAIFRYSNAQGNP